MLEISSSDAENSIQDSPSGGSDEARSESRRSFLQRSTMVTAAAAGTAAVVATARKADAGYNFNVLPFLYKGWNARNFASIRTHENAHVAFLQQALGASAFPDPGFKNLAQPNARAFAITSRIFENTGVATYLGALPLIFNPAYVAAAGSIALVEGRHSGYLNTLLDYPIDASIVAGAAPDEPFDSPQTPTATAQSIAPYLANPSFGMELAAAISTTPSPQNDVAILQFALLLEYLERDYYNINVPRFLHVMS